MFPSAEKALEFVKKWGLDEARTKLLTELGRVLEASAIHAKNEDFVKAVEVLSASTTRSEEHVRLMIEYLSRGLRRGFTLGTTITPSSSPTLSRLLALVDRLDENAKAERGFDEVRSLFTHWVGSPSLYLQLAMFQAIQRADHPALRTLAKTFIGTGNDLAALLCLDHVFSPAPELTDFQLTEIQASLSLYLDYIRLLNKVLRDGLSAGSTNQRLFGFQVLKIGRWLVPKRTLLHAKLTGQSGSGGQSMDGYKCGADELRSAITEIIRSRIFDRTKVQNNACCEVRGFLPCLHLLVQGKCSPPDGQPCTFQHIKQDQLTVDWYHELLRLILLQFKILDTARYSDPNVVKYDMVHSARNSRGCSFIVKLLAWDIILSTTSTLPVARILRGS